MYKDIRETFYWFPSLFFLKSFDTQSSAGKTIIWKWHGLLKQGRELFENDPRSSRIIEVIRCRAYPKSGRKFSRRCTTIEELFAEMVGVSDAINTRASVKRKKRRVGWCTMTAFFISQSENKNRKSLYQSMYESSLCRGEEWYAFGC